MLGPISDAGPRCILGGSGYIYIVSLSTTLTQGWGIGKQLNDAVAGEARLELAPGARPRERA